MFSKRNSLLKALESGNVETFKKYLQKIDNPDILGRSGEPIVVDAIRSGNVLILKALVNAGVDLRVRSKNGKDLYSLAYEKKNRELIQLLLEHSEEIPTRSLHSDLYIRTVTEENDYPMIQLLIDKGMDISGVVQGDPELLILSVKQNNEKMTREFLSGYDASGVIDQKGNNLLHLAIIQRNDEIIDLLINSGIDLNWKNMEGETPFDTAVHTGHFQCALKLLKEEGISNNRLQLINRLYIPCMNYWKKKILALNQELREYSSVDYNRLMKIMSEIYQLLIGFSSSYNAVIHESKTLFPENLEINELAGFKVPVMKSMTPEDNKTLTQLRENAEGNVIRILLKLNMLALPESDQINAHFKEPTTLASLSEGILIEGGSGESIDEALKVLHAKDHRSGVMAEYEYLHTNLHDVKEVKLARPHFEYKGNLYDELKVEFNDGKTENFFFEITEFFGLTKISEA